MSFFEKVFSETQTDRGVAPGAVARQDSESPFAAFVKEMVRFGAPKAEPELAHEEPDTPFEETFDEEVELDEVSVFDEEDVDSEEFELQEEEVPSAPTLPVPAQSTAVQARPVSSGVVQASSVEQKSDVQVQRIVDGLFDRMRVVWGNEDRKAPAPAQQKRQLAEQTQQPQRHYPVTVSKTEITKAIRSEVPRAIKGELVSVLRSEIMSAVRSEITRVVREEFEVFAEAMSKHLERLHAIEARLAKIEGSVEKEVKINFPKGAVQIDAPITIPEREVKVAAPINVQPPSVNFDEGAISVHFNKTVGGKKEVHFERDPHDQTIKSAEIIDVQTK